MFSVLGAAEQQGDTLTVSPSRSTGPTPSAPAPRSHRCSLDRSGSMRGRRAHGLHPAWPHPRSWSRLQEGDRLDVVFFRLTSACAPLENFVVGRDDPTRGRRPRSSALDPPQGGTDLDAGLNEALARAARPGPRRGPRRPQPAACMLITDAKLNTRKRGRAPRERGRPGPMRTTGSDSPASAWAATSTIAMLDRLTEKGKGAYVYLGSEAVVDRVFGSRLRQPHPHRGPRRAASASTCRRASRCVRFYGEEASTDPADVQPIHYYAGTSQLFLQDLTAAGRPDRSHRGSASRCGSRTGTRANRRGRSPGGLHDRRRAA